MASIRLYFAACCFLLLFSQCKKPESGDAAGERLEMYGLKSFQWLGNGVCAVDPASVVLENAPLATNDGIVSYNQSEYLFEFKGQSAQNVKNLMPRAPFAVTVDGEIVYIGVCMQAIMSSTCFESITLDNLVYGSNKARLSLGYPGVLSGTTPIDDRRNDPKILAVLKKQGKLKP